MKKILLICCILLLCGCSKKEEAKELLTDNDFGFTVIVDDGKGLNIGFKIKNVNEYIGDQYNESKKNNQTIYYNEHIQITLNKKNEIKKIELLSNHYQIEGNIRIGQDQSLLDYNNHKEHNHQYIAYSENKTVKITYVLKDNIITKIILSEK